MKKWNEDDILQALRYAGLMGHRFVGLNEHNGKPAVCVESDDEDGAWKGARVVKVFRRTNLGWNEVKRKRAR